MVGLNEQFKRLRGQIEDGRAGLAGAVVDMSNGSSSCFSCGAAMAAQKTARRDIATLAYGRFVSWEVVAACPNGCKHPNGRAVIGRSESLAALVPQGARYGYDIEVFVGVERFLRSAQREEIRGRLEKDYGIAMSAGEISNLISRFLSHIETLHYRKAPLLRAAMEADGGYPMHVDSTTEEGKGMTLAIISGWRGYVLGAWKIPTERAEYIEPRITQTSEIFGEPLSIMRDLGHSMERAALDAAGKMGSPPRQLVCHYHFLDDVGEGLLDESYGRLRARARHHNVRERVRLVVRELRKKIGADDIASFHSGFGAFVSGDGINAMPDGMPGGVFVSMLAQWILEYRQDAGNSPYPFGRPYMDLYLRCRKACIVLGDFLDMPYYDEKARQQFLRLQKAVSPFLQCMEVASAVQDLNGRIALFDGLRAVFQLESANPESAASIDKAAANMAGSACNDAGNAFEEHEADMKHMATKLLESLKQKHSRLSSGCDMSKAVKIVIDHLDRHWQYLWGHRAYIQVGGVFIHRAIERTNNLLETFFHAVKHRERRRSGRKCLGSDFDGMPASAMLAANLLNDNYVELVCGSLEHLPLLFGQIDQDARSNAYNQCPQPNIPAKGHLPNNKTFVRGSNFNNWVDAASKNSCSNNTDNDTIVTSEYISPFDMVDSIVDKCTAI